MMSQQSGGPCAGLIRVNTVIQAVVTEISEERQEQSIKAGKKVNRQISVQNERNGPESKHNDQTEKDERVQKCQLGQYKTSR